RKQDQCARSAVGAEFLASKPPPRPDRTSFHHWFHKGAEYLREKVRRLCGCSPLQWPTDGGCADGEFARARVFLLCRQRLWPEVRLDSTHRSQKKSARQSALATVLAPRDRHRQVRAPRDRHRRVSRLF